MCALYYISLVYSCPKSGKEGACVCALFLQLYNKERLLAVGQLPTAVFGQVKCGEFLAFHGTFGWKEPNF